MGKIKLFVFIALSSLSLRVFANNPDIEKIMAKVLADERARIKAERPKELEKNIKDYTRWAKEHQSWFGLSVIGSLIFGMSSIIGTQKFINDNSQNSLGDLLKAQGILLLVYLFMQSIKSGKKEYIGHKDCLKAIDRYKEEQKKLGELNV